MHWIQRYRSEKQTDTQMNGGKDPTADEIWHARVWACMGNKNQFAALLLSTAFINKMQPLFTRTLQSFQCSFNRNSKAGQTVLSLTYLNKREMDGHTFVQYNHFPCRCTIYSGLGVFGCLQNIKVLTVLSAAPRSCT